MKGGEWVTRGQGELIVLNCSIISIFALCIVGRDAGRDLPPIVVINVVKVNRDEGTIPLMDVICPLHKGSIVRRRQSQRAVGSLNIY